MKYRLQENMINDLTGKLCQVIEIKARTDFPKGITPFFRSSYREE